MQSCVREQLATRARVGRHDSLTAKDFLRTLFAGDDDEAGARALPHRARLDTWWCGKSRDLIMSTGRAAGWRRALALRRRDAPSAGLLIRRPRTSRTGAKRRPLAVERRLLESHELLSGGIAAASTLHMRTRARLRGSGVLVDLPFADVFRSRTSLCGRRVLLPRRAERASRRLRESSRRRERREGKSVQFYASS